MIERIIKEKIVEFDPSTHTYWIDGNETLSATQIATFLNPFRKMKIPERALKMAGEKGTMIHDCIDFYLKNAESNISTTHEHYNYFQAFLDLYASIKDDLQILHHEQLAIAERELDEENIYIAGTIDLVCKLKGRVSIIDWKTSSAMTLPEWRLQLTIYKYLVEYTYGYEDIDVYIGWIKKNGSWELIKIEPLNEMYMYMLFTMLTNENQVIVNKFNLLLHEIYGDEIK